MFQLFKNKKKIQQNKLLNSNSSKIKIVELFNKNVKGKKSDTSTSNIKHAGKEGHWLETQMNIAHNADNLPDILGFEMKNETTSKTTFGDWSADYYIYHDNNYGLTRDEFIKTFGKSNLKKLGRYSWSGEPCPSKIGEYNNYGQIMVVDEDKSISIIYSYEKDKRPNKQDIIPLDIQKNNLIIVKWEASSLKNKVEKKFNNCGWFKCLKDNDGTYSRIVFGNPINFETWIGGVINGLIFFDSGMYQGNTRNYSEWRAYNNYWNSLITESY